MTIKKARKAAVQLESSYDDAKNINAPFDWVRTVTIPTYLVLSPTYIVVVLGAAGGYIMMVIISVMK